jgi:hypothetical protein
MLVHTFAKLVWLNQTYAISKADFFLVKRHLGFMDYNCICEQAMHFNIIADAADLVVPFFSIQSLVQV